MILAHIARTWGSLKKTHQFHQEQARFFLDLFNRNKPAHWDIDAQPAPLLDFYQRTTEYHTAQMFTVNEMLTDYQKAVENTIFEQDGFHEL